MRKIIRWLQYIQSSIASTGAAALARTDVITNVEHNTKKESSCDGHFHIVLI